jgi:hypothetical protein
LKKQFASEQKNAAQSPSVKEEIGWKQFKVQLICYG